MSEHHLPPLPHEFRVSEKTAAKACLGIDSGWTEEFDAEGRRRLVAKKNSRLAVAFSRVKRWLIRNSTEIAFWIVVLATLAASVELVLFLM